MLNRLVSPSEDVIEWLATAMRERHKASIDTNGKLADSIQTQIDRLVRMDANLYDDKLAGDIALDRYELKHIELMAEKIELEDRLSKIDQTIGLKLEHKLVLLELSQKAAELYPKKSPEQKRIIITKLFEKFDYRDGNISVTYTNFARAIAKNVQITRNLMGGAI
jgi:hypothetical protein